jgi:hypothetical protein
MVEDRFERLTKPVIDYTARHLEIRRRSSPLGRIVVIALDGPP